MNTEINDIDQEDKAKLDLTPIHKFVIKYSIPHPIANKLIGRTEQETDCNIKAISNAIDEYVDKCIDIILEETSKDDETTGLWNAPYGYKKDSNNELLEVPKEQRIIRFIIKSRKKGLTITEICNRLTRVGVKTRRGKIEWQTSVIIRVLKRKREKQNGKENEK